jgi:hypothetical protein
MTLSPWLYNTLGHKLRFPQAKKAQFVTVMGIKLTKERRKCLRLLIWIALALLLFFGGRLR